MGWGQIARIPAAVAIGAMVATSCAQSRMVGPGTLPRLGAAPAAVRHVAAARPPSGVKEQLVGTVDRYFAVLDDLPVRMDAAALARLLTPGCPCQEQVRSIRDAASKGQHYVDSDRINAIRPNLDGPGSADVLVDYYVIRGGLVDAAGHRLHRVPPHRVWWDFRLVRRHARWLISRIEAVS